MKKLFLSIALIALCVGAMAQQSYSFRKGYRGDVALGGAVGITKGVRNDAFSLSTTHGYSFGDGLFVGAGAGLNVLTSAEVTIPVYFVGKYTFMDNRISPFMDCRVGWEALVYNRDHGVAFVVSPAVGVDLGRFSLRAGYLCEAGRYVQRGSLGQDVVSAMKLHSVTITAAVAF